MKTTTIILSIFVAIALVGTALAVGPGKTVEYAGGDAHYLPANMGTVTEDGTLAVGAGGGNAISGA